jgi:hypothetical protein
MSRNIIFVLMYQGHKVLDPIYESFILIIMLRRENTNKI